MTKQLTISVAAYNVEAYLRETLSSCVAEEILDEIEVLVVSDGSSDATADIAREYCEAYPGSFRLIEKENGGYGSTVNTAMREASGRYFRLLEGDDYFEKEGLLALVKALRCCDSDWVVTPYCRVADGSNVKEVKPPLWERYSGRTMKLSDTRGDIRFGMWGVTAKTEMLRRHPFLLPEHRLYTDQQFVVYMMPHVKTVTFLPELLYAYRVGREGQSVSRVSRIAHKADTVDSIRRILYFCGKKVSPDHPNRHAIRERAGVYLIYAFLTLMLEKPSLRNYRELLSLMSYAKRISPDICEEAKRRKRLIRLLYASCGAAYFARAGRIDNWN